MQRFLILYASMTVFAAALAGWTGCPSLFALPESRGLLVASLALAVALGLGVVGLGRVLERLAWYRSMALFLKRLVTSPDLLGPELDGEKAFVVALYSGVGEEALFRGFVQPWIIQQLVGFELAGWAVPLGVVLASLVFGALHFPLVKELVPWTAFAIVAGILFGALAAWSGSLIPPILAHLLINWLNLRRLIHFPDPPGPPGPVARPRDGC